MSVKVYSGLEKAYPYSLSRWTDVVGTPNKWDWLKEQLTAGYMLGFNPLTGVPVRWSLKPEETLGLIFWTRAPANLIKDAHLFREYKVKVHMTVTGWHEVEKGAPSLKEGAQGLRQLVGEFGQDNVSWRFSPVPMVADVRERFSEILDIAASCSLKSVYLSFLQPNDRMPETRAPEERRALLGELAGLAGQRGVEIRLCNEDRLLANAPSVPNLCSGVCAPPEDFELAGRSIPDAEGCGCVLMVDPFSINEACAFGCQFCLDPNTLVLFDDFVWRNLGDVKVGDTLVGFDEEVPGYREQRKFRHSVVEGVYRFKKPILRIITETTELLTTADHLWLEGKSRKSWKRADHLSLDCKLQHFGVTPYRPVTDQYKMGYISGMTAGDGTISLTKDKQIYWRVALTDVEPLDRLTSYLRDFGVDAPIRPFNSGSPFTKTPMQKVETRVLSSVQKIHGFDSAVECDEYRRGFLSGLYDAEGSYNKSVRIAQIKDNGLLKRACDYAQILGVDMYVEKSGVNSRLAGTMRGKASFFSLINPAIARKTEHFFGKSIDFSLEPILAIEHYGVREVVDIRTSTRTFLANGVATHNCYTADKSSANHKRNTTKPILPVLQR